MVRVAGAAVAFDFGVDSCTAGASVFELFKNEHGSTLANDETFTVCIEGSGCFFWIIIEVSCETSGPGESSDGERVDA
jgi:hypothetical protein